MASFVDGVNETNTCRICFEPELSEDKLVSPCNCSGSQEYVHLSCLATWQATVLFQEKSSGPDEIRHLICNTCGTRFQGICVPTRKKLLASACGEELVASLQVGSFLVASRSNSERPFIAENFPALVAALFKLKRAHWKYSVYFVISIGVTEVDDLEGESKICALNLTRLMDGSADHPIPDEVLNQQQVLAESYRRMQEATCASTGQDTDSVEKLQPSFPRIIIKHHNGGPVKWSSNRTGMCAVGKDLFQLQEKLRQRGFVSDTETIGANADPSEVFLSSFLLIPLFNQSTLVVGQFSLIVDLVQSIRHLFADDSEIEIFSFSGFAEWKTAQLLREIARGSWGVVSPEIARIACEELMGPCHDQGNDTTTAYPSLEELHSVGHVASYSVSQSSFAGEMDVEVDQGHLKDESMHEGPDQSQGMKDDVKVSVSKAQVSESFPDNDDDELPPIPKPVRVATRGSITRARSASSVQTAAPPGGDGNMIDRQKQSNSMDVVSSETTWRDYFSGINESVMWEKMIDISVESGDNVIRRSYN